MIINTKINTNSKVESIKYDKKSNLWLIKTSAPKIEGKANNKVIEQLADYFKVSKSLISIKRGFKSNYKTIEIVD